MFHSMSGVKLFALKQEPITILTALSVAVSAGSAYESYRSNKSAQRHSQEQYRIQQRQAEIQRQRERRQAIATAHEQQAAVVARTIASGAGGGSSGSQGEAASLGSQIASNIGYATEQGGLSDAASSEAAAANKATGKATTFQELGALPGQLGIQPNVKTFIE
jgi:hypothetical protein